VAGFLAALMSQIDSTLNSASTLVTMDFVKVRRPQLDERQLLRIGRVTTAVFMALAAAWATRIEQFGSLFRYLQNVLAYIDLTARPDAPIVWSGRTAANESAALRVLIWENPHPQKLIRAFTIRSAKAAGSLMVLSLTGLDAPTVYPRGKVSSE